VKRQIPESSKHTKAKVQISLPVFQAAIQIAIFYFSKCFGVPVSPITATKMLLDP